MKTNSAIKPGKNSYKILFATNTVIMNYKFAESVPGDTIIVLEVSRLSELARVCDLSRTTLYKYIDPLEE